MSRQENDSEPSEEHEPQHERVSRIRMARRVLFSLAQNSSAFIVKRVRASRFIQSTTRRFKCVASPPTYKMRSGDVWISIGVRGSASASYQIVFTAIGRAHAF